MHPKQVLSNSMKSARYEGSTIRTWEESGDTEGPIVDPRLSCMGRVIHVTKCAQTCNQTMYRGSTPATFWVSSRNVLVCLLFIYSMEQARQSYATI